MRPGSRRSWAGMPEHAPLPRSAGEGHAVPAPIRVSFEEGDDPENKRSSPNRWAGAAGGARRLTPPSGSRSCCTTCSACHSPNRDILDRSEAAAQKLASRARRRVRARPSQIASLRVSAARRPFFAASRDGDLDALSECSLPTSSYGSTGACYAPTHACAARCGGRGVAHSHLLHAVPVRQARACQRRCGGRAAPGGRVFSVMAFTVTDRKILQIDALVDPERLEQTHLSFPPVTDKRA